MIFPYATFFLCAALSYFRGTTGSMQQNAKLPVSRLRLEDSQDRRAGDVLIDYHKSVYVAGLIRFLRISSSPFIDPP